MYIDPWRYSKSGHTDENPFRVAWTRHGIRQTADLHPRFMCIYTDAKLHNTIKTAQLFHPNRGWRYSSLCISRPHYMRVYIMHEVKPTARIRVRSVRAQRRQPEIRHRGVVSASQTASARSVNSTFIIPRSQRVWYNTKQFSTNAGGVECMVLRWRQEYWF